MKHLFEGMMGDAVVELKEKLNAMGYDCGEGNMYDRKTAWAVRWFCHRNGLHISGEATEAVWMKIQAEDAMRGVGAEFPYYSMKDPIWAEYPYDAANTPEVEVMGSSSCGPTSMAMAVSAATKRAVLPPVLADWSNAAGFRDPDGQHGTSDDFFPACAAQFGLTSELVPIVDEASFERVKEELANGNAVIANVIKGSPYTRGGHYNLISKIDGDRIHICDPVPKNNELPDYTIGEWVEGNFARHYLVIAKQ